MRNHTMTGLRCLAGAAAGLAVLWAEGAASKPRASESLTLIGFSSDGQRFAAVIAEPGEPEGTLRAWSADTGEAEGWEPTQVPLGPDGKGRPSAEVLSPYDLGADPGTERYTSGTSRATRFAVNGAPVRVEIAPGALGDASGPPRPTVLIRRGRCAKEVPTGADGIDANLVNVLTSRDGGSLAVIVKTTQGELRRHHVVVVRLSQGELAEPSCLDPADPQPTAGPAPKPDRRGAGTAACLEALRALKGSYAGQERIKDPAGGAEVSLFELTIEPGGGRPSVQLVSNPGAGKAICGAIVGCEQRQGELIVSTRDRSGACGSGSLGIRRLANGSLEVDYQAYTETFLKR